MRRLIGLWLIPASLLVACGAPPSESTPAPAPPPATPPPAVSSPPQSGPVAPPSVVVPVTPSKPPDPGFAIVRDLTKMFYEGDLVKLHSRFSKEMKKTVPVEHLTALRARVQKEYGKEVAVLGEDWQAKDKYRGFVRWSRFDKHEGVIEVQWILHRDDDEVAGFFIQPAKTNKKSS
jgi:hypothetical protein